MSEKRQFMEFHDPDYLQFQPKPSTSHSNETSPSKPEDKHKAICRIIDREFQRELKSKEDELDEINRRLDEAKQLLAKVRYAVVNHYYSKKSLLCTQEEMAQVEKVEKESMTHFVSPNDGNKTQMAIHPSLKKLLGKRPVDYNEILKTRSPRQAAKNATEQFHKLVKKPKGKIDEGISIDESIVKEELDTEPKKPRYVAPSSSNKLIPQINSARGRNHYRHLLVVGNTSKYIGHEEAELATNVTHKWLVYIAAKTDVAVEKIVNRVRFFLHESYKPNDVVEVSSPPFQLAKRGWGEFPIRVQLHFHEHLLQKPLQIFHTLVLDKKHSGLQTMGAETIVELWLNIPNTISDGECSNASIVKTEIVPQESTQHELESPSLIRNIKEEKADEEYEQEATSSAHTIQYPSSVASITAIPQIICDQNISSLVNTPSTPQIVSTPQTPSTPQRVSTPQKASTSNTISTPNTTSMTPTLNTQPIMKLHTPKPTLIALPKNLPSIASGPGKKLIKCVSKDGKVSLIELVQDSNNPKIFKMIIPKKPIVQVQQVMKNPPATNSVPVVIAPTPMTPSTNQQNITIIKSNPLKRSNTAPLPTDTGKKVVLIDPKRVQPSQQQRSLLRPQISLLKKNNTPAPTLGRNNGKVITVSNIPGLQSKNINVFLPFDVRTPAPKIEFRRHARELEQRFHSCNNFSNITDAVCWLLKQIPLVNPQAAKSEFRDSFPFVVQSLSVFQSLLPGKQRSFEWLRAKYINRLIAKHERLTNLKKWSTKEIVIFCRWYGYTPQSTNAELIAFKEQNLRDMVKSELIREHLQNDTISFNTRLTNWIENVEGTRTKSAFKSFDNQIVIVDDDDDDDCKGKVTEHKSKDSGFSHLLIDNKFQTELSWINDICRRLQIRFEPEAITEGVMHRSSELMLAIALRSFVEDLIRKSCGNKLRTNISQNSITEVTSDDVLQTVSKIPHFDFLTNKHLGIDRPDTKS